jgi:hypothetical protein
MKDEHHHEEHKADHAHSEGPKETVKTEHNEVKPAVEVKQPEHKPEDHPKKEETHDVEVGRHMKSSKELTGYPKFPAGTKSLLSKFLTKDIWEKL